MSDIVIVALISGAAVLISALIGLAGSLWVKKDVRDLHLIVNSRLTELLDASKGQSHAEGVLEGKSMKRSDSGPEPDQITLEAPVSLKVVTPEK